MNWLLAVGCSVENLLEFGAFGFLIDQFYSSTIIPIILTGNQFYPFHHQQ
jgi:hypothetical protein